MSVIGKPVIIGGSSETELTNLWENNAKTTAFTPKTVTLNGSVEDYDFVLFKCGMNTEEIDSVTNQKGTAPEFPNMFGLNRTIELHTHTSSGNNNQYRLLTIPTATTVAFQAGGQGNSANNSRVIPYAVEGVTMPSVELLWSQEAPETFSGNVTIQGLSKYPILCVDYQFTQSIDRHFFAWVTHDVSTLNLFVYSDINSKGGLRPVTIDRVTGDITFGDAQYTGVTTLSERNRYCIPVGIIGIKAREVDLT